MRHLLVLALASFFVWECTVRPLLAQGLERTLLPDLADSYVKSLAVASIVLALHRWEQPWVLNCLAAAAVVGFLSLLTRTGNEEFPGARVERRPVRRGMPTPG